METKLCLIRDSVLLPERFGFRLAPSALIAEILQSFLVSAVALLLRKVIGGIYFLFIISSFVGKSTVRGRKTIKL